MTRTSEWWSITDTGAISYLVKKSTQFYSIRWASSKVTWICAVLNDRQIHKIINNNKIDHIILTEVTWKNHTQGWSPLHWSLQTGRRCESGRHSACFQGFDRTWCQLSGEGWCCLQTALGHNPCISTHKDSVIRMHKSAFTHVVVLNTLTPRYPLHILL